MMVTDYLTAESWDFRPAMVLPMATGIMLWTTYVPTDTGAPSLMLKGTCSARQAYLALKRSKASQSTCCSD